MAEAEQQSQGRPRCPGRRLVRSDVSGCLRVIVRRRYQNTSRRTVGLSRRVAHDHTTLYFVRDGFHRLQNDVRHPVSVPVFAAQHYRPASHDRVCFECFLVARMNIRRGQEERRYDPPMSATVRESTSCGPSPSLQPTWTCR